MDWDRDGRGGGDGNAQQQLRRIPLGLGGGVSERRGIPREPICGVGVPMKVLIAGGCGFISSNFVRWYLAERDDVEVIVLDKLTYAGNLQSLADVLDNPR